MLDRARMAGRGCAVMEVGEQSGLHGAIPAGECPAPEEEGDPDLS
jgi:hypothetical protein